MPNDYIQGCPCESCEATSLEAAVQPRPPSSSWTITLGEPVTVQSVDPVDTYRAQQSEEIRRLLENRLMDAVAPPPPPPPTVTRRCIGCYERFPRNEVTATSDGHWVCAECAVSVPTCDRCSEDAWTTHETINGDFYCISCVEARNLVSCSTCQAYGSRSHMASASGGRRVCRTCRQQHWWTCNDCSELIDSGDYCSSCERNNQDRWDLIKNYGYKPIPEFHGEPGETLHLGMELEINTPRSGLTDCARLATEHLGGLGYLKDDSSISCGFEIVTHPMTHQYAAESFPWAMLEELRAADCSSNNVGLHVHVSRAGFDGVDHAARWLNFIFASEVGVVKIARRQSSEWARFSNWDPGRAESIARREDYGPARYMAVNCQNSETFELRVFASTLDRIELKSALDLAAGSVEYTRVHESPDWDGFVAWAAEQPHYEALVAQIGA